MAGDTTSIEVILDFVRAERDKQLAHFDSLDTKAGVVLGFAGVLIALSPDVSLIPRLAGVLASVAAAAAAVLTFWPRAFPILEPTPLRKYAAAEPAFTRLTLLDTLEVMVAQGSNVLRSKSGRLKVALSSLALAALSYSIGLLL